MCRSMNRAERDSQPKAAAKRLTPWGGAKQTPVEYLSPGNGQTKQGYLWACKRPGSDVSFTWTTSRAARCLDHIIPADFSGTVQCDGYAAYPSFANRSEGRITLAACWAHARRKLIRHAHPYGQPIGCLSRCARLHEATESTPQQAGWMLLQIQHLYRIEKQMREAKAGPQQRQAVRASQSRMIVDRIHRVLTRIKLKRQHLPQSAMGRAIDYTLTLWPMLIVNLEDGRVEIDNNPVERSIRPTAIGKKNWLFIGEAEAGQRSAILFTIIEACRSRGIDPQTYLRDVLTRLPTLTNRQIKERHPRSLGQGPADRQPAEGGIVIESKRQSSDQRSLCGPLTKLPKLKQFFEQAKVMLSLVKDYRRRALSRDALLGHRGGGAGLALCAEPGGPVFQMSSPAWATSMTRR
jgi:hypothetical protein